MRKYTSNGYEWYYSRQTQLWTIYKINGQGERVGKMTQFDNKEQLVNAYPQIKFKFASGKQK